LAIGVYVCCIYTAACSDNLVFGWAVTRCVHISVLGYTNRHIVLETSWALPFFTHHHRYSSCSFLLSCSDILSTQSYISSSASTSSMCAFLAGLRFPAVTLKITVFSNTDRFVCLRSWSCAASRAIGPITSSDVGVYVNIVRHSMHCCFMTISTDGTLPHFVHL